MNGTTVYPLSLGATDQTVALTVTQRGGGRPFLLLHGGGGPQTVLPFAELLADGQSARVVVPVHPGFGGTVRPAGLDSIGGLAALYTELLAELDLTDVVVIGNSIGGWIAAEMAALGSPRISAMILVDASGVELADRPAVDFFSLTMAEVAQLSYHNPEKFRIDVDTLPPAARQVMAGNRAALASYTAAGMGDPTLPGRLAGVTVPTLVLWGASDRMIHPDHGRAYAAAIAGAEFRLLPEVGHLPQLEAPQQLLAAISTFVSASVTGHSGR